MKGLLKRAITALIFVAIMLCGIFTNCYTFIALFGIIATLCSWEFLKLVLPSSPFSFKISGVILTLIPFILMGLFYFANISLVILFLLVIIFICLLFTIFIFELFSSLKQPFHQIGFLFLSIIYIGLPIALTLFLVFNNNGFNPVIIFSVLLLTWANDTGAYLVGSRIGKTALYPRISPNKTWEGSSGGIITTLLLGGGFYLFFQTEPLFYWLILASLVACFGSIGDLVESMLKRSVSMKDSGNLLPGHGGMLDRFDAFIFVIPFVTLFELIYKFTYY